jgi:hypothetical protein
MDPLLMGGILGDLTSRGCSGAGQADPGHRVARRASSMSRSDWHPAGESAMMAISSPLSLSLLGTSTWRAQAKGRRRGAPAALLCQWRYELPGPATAGFFWSWPLKPARARYFASRRRRSIVCAICSCCSAIFVKPLARSCFARARCHSGVA